MGKHTTIRTGSSRRFEWWYSHSSTTTGCRVYWQNVIKLALSLSILRHSNISAYSGCRRMGIPPFKPAHRDELNGGIPIRLRPLDAEFIGKMSSNWHYYFRYCAI